jgi:GGDEF domain-containing protein
VPNCGAHRITPIPSRLTIPIFQPFCCDRFAHAFEASSYRAAQQVTGILTARYGGEAFAVVLPNTALRQALTVADPIRRAVMAKDLKSNGEIPGRSVDVCLLKRRYGLTYPATTQPSTLAAIASSARAAPNIRSRS